MTPHAGGFVRRAAAAIASLPFGLRLVLLLTAVLHGVGLTWGLPSSDAWDNDGVAPRDFLPGLAATFTPGQYYTYPPLHLALLAVLTAPVTVLAAIRASAPGLPGILAEILKPPYMTAMSVTARVVCLLMSLGLVIAIAKIADETAGEDARPRAGIGAALVLAVGRPFTYYSHTSNLDVPALFWASLGALWLTRAIARREPRRLRMALVFAALATATKDQAYAVFLLGLPLTFATWLAFDPWARANITRIAKDGAVGALLLLGILAVVDGPLLNPTGFRARLAFLSGSASQDFATYPKNVHGLSLIVGDTFRDLSLHYPRDYVVFWWGLLAAGVVIAVERARRRGGQAVAASLVPLAFAVSFTVCFNMVARRVEERFTLPQVVLMSVYGGHALERAWLGLRSRPFQWVARAACAFMVGRALFGCIELDVNLLRDPRYATEDFLAREAKPGDTIEVHGLNVYLPRFPPDVHVVRVGPRDPATRGPIPGVEEVRAPFMAIDERRPRFVVVSECYVWRYLPRNISASSTRIMPITQGRDASDADPTQFFQSLVGGRLGYHLVHDSHFESSIFDRVFLHSSVGCSGMVYERTTP